MARNSLDLMIKQKVPAGVSVLQIDDGTVFYWRYSSPQRLYIIKNSEEIDAKLPEVTIDCDVVHGNAIYFSTKIRIFKTVFTPNGGVEVVFVRNILPDERDTTGGIMMRVRDGKKYAYGMWDDPERDGVVHVESAETVGMRLTSTIRDKIIYLTRKTISTPSVRHLRSDAIVLEIPTSVSTDDRLSTPFYYFTCNETLYALNTTSWTILPPLKINNIESIDSFAGIVNGVITLRVQMGNARYMATAELPKEYVASQSVPQPASECAPQNADEETFESLAKTIETDLSTILADLQSLRSAYESGEADSDDTSDASSDAGLDDLTEQCCCAICSETFEPTKYIPRVLDCGHTFCEICIYNERICVSDIVTCPNCSRVINVQGKVLPINYTIIGMAEQLMKTKADPKVACKSCKTKHPTSAVRLCTKNDCATYNQLLCLSCVVDGGHGGHVVKYDVRMDKIRSHLRVEIEGLCAQVEEKRRTVLDKSKELLRDLEIKLSEAAIPPDVFGQLNKLASEQEAKEYREIIRDLTTVLLNECDTLAEEFDRKLNVTS